MADPTAGQPGTWQHLCRWRDGALDLRATAAAMPATDTHAALALRGEYPGWLHHCPDTSVWYIWDGRCHCPDSSDRAARLIQDYALRYERAIRECREVARQQAALTAGTGAPAAAVRQAQIALWEPFAAAEKYAAGLLRRTGSAALRMVLGEHCGTPESEMAERNPYLLNFRNGTLDLKRKVLRPHDPADMITYCLDADYLPDAACPLYWELVHRACGRDREVTAFLARVLGYSLLGRNPRQHMFFLAGPTASGKSALLSVLSRSLGPLGHESQPALVCLTKHGRNARTENSIRGARLVTITETSAYMTIDEAQLKRLTGEEWLNIDQHYAKAELGTPVTWTIVLATNNMPLLVNFDDAMRRRVIVIPMGATIPWHERDEELVRKITDTEKDAILSWLAREAMAYLDDGLAVPEAVSSFTGEYAAGQDTVGQFAADRCLLNGHLGKYSVPASIGQMAAWEGYQAWAGRQPKLGRNDFYTAFGKLPGVRRNEDQRRFEGIMWKQEGPLSPG